MIGSMNSFIDNLQKALQNEQIREMIRQIAAAPAGENAPACAPPESGRLQEEQEKSLRAQLEKLQAQAAGQKAELAQARQERQRFAALLEQGRQENLLLQNQLRQAAEQLEEAQGQLQAAKEQALFAAEKAKAAEQREAEYRGRMEKMQAQAEPFSPLLDCFAAYRTLPQELLRALSASLPCEEPLPFFAAGCQMDALLRFLDTAALSAQSLLPQQVQVLAQVTGFFLQQQNALWSAPIYELIFEEAGKPFDEERHLRSSDCSRYQGDIAQVLLPGIWNLNRRRADRKCIVRY